ncbi:DNA-binding transcriptional LysR family regulator [Paenibacillus amylolyticus]|uniref:DNA-binding transcriptional LysR family regulator n=1 Tax=Paenibacillus amylolyticus TaxID=1451 RepID=A0AAP5H3B0_PAEAM|nr:LysR family transcriptional regulator [Paenibacillus amylolyticus]MDR6723314.1 DNA-binding transcriptional LysR family regulator [Paenibacillus amylolyticus]
MELRYLEAFKTVCEQLHFTKAAEMLNIAQPTLSQQIKALEEEIGTPLFDRLGKKILVTEAGQILYHHCTQIFRNLDYAYDAINDLRTMQRGKLVLGVLPCDVDELLTPAVIEFHQTFPNIQLLIQDSDQIVEEVLEGSIDIGITTVPVIHDSRLIHLPLYTEQFALAISKNSELAIRSEVTLKELKDWKLVLFPDHHPCRKLINSLCEEQDFSVSPIIETSAMISLMRLVKNNVGATVLPKPLLQSWDERFYHIINLIEPTPERDISIIYRSDKFLSQAGRTFISKVMKQFT